MILIVDTSVLIDHLRNDQRAVARLVKAAERGDEIWSVAVVRAEIFAGAFPSEEAAIDELFARLRWLEVTNELADAAGRMASRYRRSHRGVDIVDFVIAAAAEQIGGQLLTQNVKHFPMFPDLQPAY